MARKAKGAIIEKKIEALLRSFRKRGISIHDLRKKLGPGIGPQEQLGRRLRNIRLRFFINWTGGKYFIGKKKRRRSSNAAISERLRVATFQKAGSRCQMCGKTVAGDKAKLQADHKIPRAWGGPTIEDNLWALCAPCNRGKRHFFSSLNRRELAALLKMESVYERIGGMLRKRKGRPIPAWLLEFVANFEDFQEDWQKRLRELRYPVIGWKIRATRSKTPTGKWQAAYQLQKWKPLPPNHQFLIKEHERKTRKKRKRAKR